MVDSLEDWEDVFEESFPENIEIFYIPASEFEDADPDSWMAEYLEDEGDPEELAGWYWWSCCPGCLPDSEPSGPFKTEEEARQDVIAQIGDW